MKKLWLTAILGIGLVSATAVGGSLVKVHGDAKPSTSELAVPKTVSAASQTASASVSGTAKNAKVAYKQSGDNTPVATYQQTTSSTTSNAAAKVPNQDHSGQTVTLSDGTKAKEQGIMGHIYVTWRKGDWSVTTVTDTEQTFRTDAKTLATQVNRQLKNEDITNQSVDKGAVTVYSSAQDTTANQITWQKHHQVRNVKAQTAGTAYQIAKTAFKGTN